MLSGDGGKSYIDYRLWADYHQTIDLVLTDYIGQVSTASWLSVYIFWLLTKCWLILSELSVKYRQKVGEVSVN